MIKITRIATTYPAPEGEEDYCPDGEAECTDELVSFRELVALMEAHPHPSSWPPSGSIREWVSTETEQDYRTGEFTECSLHYAHDNPPSRAKYWRAAMRAAGHLETRK